MRWKNEIYRAGCVQCHAHRADFSCDLHDSMSASSASFTSSVAITSESFYYFEVNETGVRYKKLRQAAEEKIKKTGKNK